MKKKIGFLTALAMTVMVMAEQPAAVYAAETNSVSVSIHHEHVGNETNGGACYTAIPHTHSAEGGACYTAIPHTHSAEGGACYTAIPHTHSGNETSGGACYTPVYHTHSAEDGECYTPVYHVHTGNSTSGGGCYGQKVQTPAGCRNVEAWEGNYYRGKYVCNKCNAVVRTWYESYKDPATGAITVNFSNPGYAADGCMNDSYSINCGKDGNTVESYTLTCDKEGVIEGYKLNCDKTIDGYKLTCNKPNDGYRLTCNKTTDGYKLSCNKDVIATFTISPSEGSKTVKEMDLTASFSGNGATLTGYKWSNGATSATIHVTGNGDYTCTVSYTDAGVTRTQSLAISVNNISANADNGGNTTTETPKEEKPADDKTESVSDSDVVVIEDEETFDNVVSDLQEEDKSLVFCENCNEDVYVLADGNCPNCGEKLLDTIVFCENCGKDVPVLADGTCSVCGEKLIDAIVFCENCGKDVYVFVDGTCSVCGEKLIDTGLTIDENGKIIKIIEEEAAKHSGLLAGFGSEASRKILLACVECTALMIVLGFMFFFGNFLNNNRKCVFVDADENKIGSGYIRKAGDMFSIKVPNRVAEKVEKLKLRCPDKFLRENENKTVIVNLQGMDIEQIITENGLVKPNSKNK